MVKKVALRVSDPKLMYYLISNLKKFDILIAEDGDIIITDNLIKKFNFDKLIGYIVCKVRGKDNFNELLIGIDTNKEEKLTVVVVGDGELIYSANSNLMEIEEKISNIVSMFPHKKLYIGVGGGNKIGELVYRMLKIKFSETKIVNENKTSSKNPFINIKDRDIRAAYLIALRSTLR
ncbi:hypothetical protein [Sulfurisphaera ohwakuensis]|uniref:Uncharacterized protein n=1 Tax=Sulfurisphaera ohwakuensis TaxID=69656 RepID=A0A650CEB6_SULOH|nr:hypothetical protein [Sulfurisphaera ohwakuensis]MBB5252952.1 hypothetical protein [Sulfurisphaera ohwakuensis]QGR16119.1 hypothetical protein D1869_02130 [Sulfurisphaera ohwakuensis]